MSHVENTLLGIGEMSRRSGLTVSALRFYDGAGLLVPAYVEPASGYRRYRDDQRADGPRAGQPAPGVVGVDPAFLLQALSVGDRLVLEPDGPVSPLAIRAADGAASPFSLLTPVRLDA